jgi:L-lactate dehydrogenase complex protein LldG
MTQNSVQNDLMAKLKRAGKNAATEQISAELKNLGRAPIPTLPSNELCEAFFINVLKNQGSVNCAANRSEAVKAVADYLHERFRNRKLVAGNDPRLAALPWRDGALLPRFGAAESGENASLSYAELGVAETGSIITYTGKNNPSANNLLVEDHLVLLDVADLVSNLEDAWEIINADALEKGRPRGINIISGPSSTGDIDAQLVLGAHGPRAWHVILMGDVPETALANAQSYIDKQWNNL